MKKPRMSGFLSTILLVIAAVLVGIAVTCWSKGDFANLRAALWWGIGGYVVFGVAAAVTYDYYVLMPAASNQPALAPQSTPSPPNERPWLSIELVPAGEGLAFNDTEMASLHVIYQVTNKGKTPANNMQVSREIFFPRSGSDFHKRVIEKQMEICRSKESPYGPRNIFPGETESFNVTSVMNVSVMREQFAQEDPGGASGFIAGCVHYIFDANGHTFTGETGFIYEIREMRPAGGERAIIIGESIPKERLIFKKPFKGGDYAK